MAKYGPKASEKVEEAVSEMKRGKLRSSSGDKVTSRKQAVAIGLSQARRAGGKVPKKRASKASKATKARKAAKATKATKGRKTTKRKTTKKR